MTKSRGRPRTPDEAVRAECKNLRNMLREARRERDQWDRVIVRAMREAETGGVITYERFSEILVEEVAREEAGAAATAGDDGTAGHIATNAGAADPGEEGRERGAQEQAEGGQAE